MQTSGQCVFAFGDRHEQVGAQRRPDLHAHTVRIGAEETEQSQVLFDPAKKQLDLPAVFVDISSEETKQLTAGRWLD